MVDDTSHLPARAPVDFDSPTRLEIIHAVVFTLGFFVSAASLFVSSATLALVGGPCLILSAALSWLGLRISLAGTVGRVLNAVLGPMPRISFHARTATWLVIGIAITTWGVWRLARPRVEEEMLPPPPAHLSLSHAVKAD